ncbi:hypothetical protein BG004_005366 [Podila humilis]|nr:hypothetical protein BG004_005366 [Podila humilis]
MRTTISFLVVIISTIIALTASTLAQSTGCHACIQKAFQTVDKCASLTPAQLTTVDTIVHDSYKGAADTSSLQTSEPAVFACLVALMWDSIEYNGKLWGSCLQPETACPWSEMMQYLTMIPRIAAVYGAPNPPAQVLLHGPA